MLIILETSRKEELHNWHAADRRYPLLMATVRYGDHDVQLYQHQIAVITQAAQRRVLQERAARHADNT